MPLALVVLALWALAFLTFNTVVSFWVWRISSLPRWRRALPGLLLCAGLAASLSRSAGTTTIAEALAFPLYVTTAGICLCEIRRHRARSSRPDNSGDLA
ncbi:hypothetical protein [Streptomyces narbonensis]|uniref:hypothetical protein n=1 Tax=Streptomyces narbonensis TaxID=67333 RepID=UPI00167795C5|nr:hypothetical protein [Streptomyces narbonensis]GGW08324.1 hypothetical protein GCM10010230_55000 [Streptomyces narbonensis]